MKKLILLLAIITCVAYSQTQIRENQIKDRSITRNKLNSDSTGRAVIKKIFAISPLAITSTGVDTGTGDVTIEFDSSFVLAKEDSIPKTDEGGFLKWVDSDWLWDANTYLKTTDTLSLSNRINTKLSTTDTTASPIFYDLTIKDNIYITTGKFYYLCGNESTDGSWRLGATASGDLLIQYRVSGNWLSKQTLTP